MTTAALRKRKGARREVYVWKEERIALRPMQARDLNLRYLSWLNDPVVNRYMMKHRYTFAEMVGYYETLRRDPKKNVFLALCHRITGRPIGTATLRDVHKSTAVFGIMIGDRRAWGKGLGERATRAVSGYAFKQFRLKKIKLGVKAENVRAIHVFQKVGFRKVSLTRGSATVGRVYQMELERKDLSTS